MVRSSVVSPDRRLWTERSRAWGVCLRAVSVVAICLATSLFSMLAGAADLAAGLPGHASRPGVAAEHLILPGLRSIEPLFDPPPLATAPADIQAPTTCSLWLVSTRAAGCGTGLEGLALYRHTPDGGWTTSSLAAFHAEDALKKLTVFFVHGNRYTADDALETGETIYQGIGAAAGTNRPVRFVIWSWPSDKLVRGQLRDLRLKAIRAEWQGIHLARFIAAMKPDVPIGLMGHSYGSRLISSALHMLGGGEISGKYLKTPPRRTAPLRVVLMAAAMGNYWMLPGERHGQAMNAVDGILVVANSQDGVLRWYPRLFPGPGANALGYTGIALPEKLGPYLDKVEQIDVAPLIGKGHNLVEYYQSSPIWQRVSRYALSVPSDR